MSEQQQEITDLEQLLQRIGEAAEHHERVSLEQILAVVGRRSFGPLLLLAGLITVAPVVGDMPGVPTAIGVFVLLIAGQLLIRRKHFWLPNWLLKRSVGRDRLRKLLKWLQRPARFIDGLIRPRLTPLTHNAGSTVIAAVCLIIAMTMPAMEVVLFAANIAGAALTAFGLALVAHDGLLALLAFAFTAATFGFLGYYFLG